MGKILTNREVAFLKRNAQNIYPRVMKIVELQNKINSLTEDLENLKQEVEIMESGSRLITGGINSTILINRKVVNINGTNKTVFEPSTYLKVLDDKTYEITYTLDTKNSEL